MIHEYIRNLKKKRGHARTKITKQTTNLLYYQLHFDLFRVVVQALSIAKNARSKEKVTLLFDEHEL